jgi:hypothetical protein
MIIKKIHQFYSFAKSFVFVARKSTHLYITLFCYEKQLAGKNFLRNKGIASNSF